MATNNTPTETTSLLDRHTMANPINNHAEQHRLINAMIYDEAMSIHSSSTSSSQSPEHNIIIHPNDDHHNDGIIVYNENNNDRPSFIIRIVDGCSHCVLSISRYMGSPHMIFIMVGLYYVCHLIVCAVILSLSWNDVCSYDYHYLFFVWIIRSLLGIRILYWQTHPISLQTSPSSSMVNANGNGANDNANLNDDNSDSIYAISGLDRFLKNWVDMIQLLYGIIWSIQPRDCLILTPLQYKSAAILTLISILSLSLRIFLWCSIYCHCIRDILSDNLFIVCRSYLKLLSAGSATSDTLLDQSHILTASELDTSSLISYNNHMYNQEDAICAICLNNYMEYDQLRLLPCQHHFHAICVDRWIMERRKCPVCRHNC